MNTAQQKQLYSQIKNLSDEQLADLLQQNDPHKSPMALGEINYRNDVRAAKAMQMNKPPTVAEQQLAKAGIGAGGMPNAEAISPMAANGVGALPDQMAPFARDNTGILRAETPMTMMAAGGGLVALAEGGQVIPFQNEGLVPYYEQEDYVPFSEQSGLQRLGGFFGDDDTWSWDEGGLGHYALEEAKDPTNLLLLGGGIGLGAQKIYQGGKTLRRMLKAKYPHLERKALDQLQDLYSKKTPGFFLGKNPRTFSPGRAIVSGTLAAKGAGAGIGALMGDDAAPEGQRELMGPPKPSAALMEQNRRANELQERLKAAQDDAKAGKGEGASTAKKTGIFNLDRLPLAASGIIAGLGIAEGKDASQAAKEGITTGLAIKQQELERDKLKADEDYKERSLALEEKQIKLVFEASMAKTGLTKAQALKEEREFKDDRRDSAVAQAREELKEINEGFLPFGLGDKDTTITEINKRAEEILDKEWMKTVISGDLRTRLSQVMQEKANRATS